jgi:hypothetical protein
VGRAEQRVKHHFSFHHAEEVPLHFFNTFHLLPMALEPLETTLISAMFFFYIFKADVGCIYLTYSSILLS